MLFKAALRNALRHPRRSAVTAVTVAVGAAALFAFQGFNDGIVIGNRDHTVHSKYGHGQVTTAGYRDKVYEKPWQHWIEDSDQVAGQLAALPDVTGVFPRIEFFALLSNGHTSIGGKGIGVFGEWNGDEFFPMSAFSDGSFFKL